jgi:hypothetical protein
MAQIIRIKTAGIASLKSNSVENGEVARFFNAIQSTKSKANTYVAHQPPIHH